MFQNRLVFYHRHTFCHYWPWHINHLLSYYHDTVNVTMIYSIFGPWNIFAGLNWSLKQWNMYSCACNNWNGSLITNSVINFGLRPAVWKIWEIGIRCIIDLNKLGDERERSKLSAWTLEVHSLPTIASNPCYVAPNTW